MLPCNRWFPEIKIRLDDVTTTVYNKKKKEKIFGAKHFRSQTISRMLHGKYSSDEARADAKSLSTQLQLTSQFKMFLADLRTELNDFEANKNGKVMLNALQSKRSPEGDSNPTDFAGNGTI